MVYKFAFSDLNTQFVPSVAGMRACWGVIKFAAVIIVILNDNYDGLVTFD